jgi:hypothetical protein
MNRTSHPFTRLAALATVALMIVLVTAGQASAMRPDPAPADPGVGSQAPARASVLVVTDSSISVLQWVLFAAAVIGGLLLGAALMHLSQRHRAQLAH